MTTKTDTGQERVKFEAWWKLEMAPRLTGKAAVLQDLCLSAWQARAALQSHPASLDMEDIEYELRNMASTAYEVAMSFGVSRDSFERMANDVFSYARSVLQSQDREDAERYRWLRDTLHGAKAGGGVEVNDALQVYETPEPGEEVRVYWYQDTPVGFYQEHGTTLDEAIDHARRVEGEGK